MEIEISLSDLRVIINRILDHIEVDLGRSNVTIAEDDYWDLTKEDRYDLTRCPVDHEVGKLHDDWEFLLSILRDKDQAVSYMLVHVAPLLLYIGEDIGR